LLQQLFSFLGLNLNRERDTHLCNGQLQLFVSHANMSKVRKLKYHEQKLLKKVDFLNWKSDGIKPEYREYMLKMINKYKLRDQKEFFKFVLGF
jgi:hypothetical protein